MKKVLLDYLWIWSITAALLLGALLTFPLKENPLENIEKRLDEASQKERRETQTKHPQSDDRSRFHEASPTERIETV